MMEESKSPNSLSKVKVFAGLGIVIALVGVMGVVSMFGVFSKVEIANLIVTNQTSNSASVVWTTDKKADVSVEVSETPDFATSLKFYDDRDVEEVGVGQYELVTGVKREIHHVTVRNLDPEKEYYFRLVNNGNKTSAEEQRIATTKTVDSLKTPDPVYGIVGKTEGSKVEEGVVLMQKVSNDAVSQTISTVLEDGTYSLDIANLMDAGLREEFAGKEYVQEINVIGLDGEILNAKVTVDKEMDQPVENITLGVDKTIVNTEVEVQTESCTCNFNADGSEKYCNAVGTQYCEGNRTLQKHCNATKAGGANHLYSEEVANNPLNCGGNAQQPADPNGNAPEVPPCTAKLGNPEQCQSPEENNNCVSLGEYNATDQKGTYASYNCVDKEVRVNRTRHPNGVCNYTFVSCVKGVNPGAGTGTTTQNNPLCRTDRGNLVADSQNRFTGTCWIIGLKQDVCRNGDTCGTYTQGEAGACKCGNTKIMPGEVCKDATQVCPTGGNPAPVQPAQPAQPADPGAAAPVVKPVVPATSQACTYKLDTQRGNGPVNPGAAGETFIGNCYINDLKVDNCRLNDWCGNQTPGKCKCGNGEVEAGKQCLDASAPTCKEPAAAPPAKGGETAAPVLDESKMPGNTTNNLEVQVNANVTVSNNYTFENTYITLNTIVVNVVGVYDDKLRVEVNDLCVWIKENDLIASVPDIAERIKSLKSSGAPIDCGEDLDTLEDTKIITPSGGAAATRTGGSSPATTSATASGWVKFDLRSEADAKGLELSYDSSKGTNPTDFKVTKGVEDNILQQDGIVPWLHHLKTNVGLKLLGRVDGSVNTYYNNSGYVLFVDSNGTQYWMQNPFEDTFYNTLPNVKSGQVVNFAARGFTGDCKKAAKINYYNIPDCTARTSTAPVGVSVPSGGAVAAPAPAAGTSMFTVSSEEARKVGIELVQTAPTGTDVNNGALIGTDDSYEFSLLSPSGGLESVIGVTSDLDPTKFSQYSFINIGRLDVICVGKAFTDTKDSSGTIVSGNFEFMLVNNNGTFAFTRNVLKPELFNSYIAKRKECSSGSGALMNNLIQLPFGGSEFLKFYAFDQNVVNPKFEEVAPSAGGATSVGTSMYTVSSPEAKAAGIEVVQQAPTGTDVNNGALIGTDDKYDIKILGATNPFEGMTSFTFDLGLTSDTPPKYTFLGDGEYSVTSVASIDLAILGEVKRYDFNQLTAPNGANIVVRNLLNTKLFESYKAKGKNSSSILKTSFDRLAHFIDEIDFKQFYSYDEVVGYALGEDALEVSIASESQNVLDPGKYTITNSNVTTKEFTLTTPGQVVYFQDLNGDGVKQDNEPLYDGDVASLNIQFNKVSEVQSYEIKNGWNLLSFPILMRGDGTSNLNKASDLIKKLKDSNIVATHVITYRSGKFVLYSSRSDDNGIEIKFGEDFSLLPGEGYFIRSYSTGSLLVDGNKIQNSQEIAVENGWNLVGFYNSNKLSYGGFDVLTQVSTAGISSDSLSKWEDGMYYSIISQNGKQYGNDFKVYPTQGYFLRVSNKGVGKFAPN